eukprot:TRINITY_DN23519_c0_g1_i1.p1 TRINITY_DN23519_c0_g1~~TRINITY_DN23519_c0_g1_i1.p1  ORF type:complete len:520 (+),score=88.26 TRINITY_DN23519_c0_g1_i1:97-1656(+)
MSGNSRRSLQVAAETTDESSSSSEDSNASSKHSSLVGNGTSRGFALKRLLWLSVAAIIIAAVAAAFVYHRNSAAEAKPLRGSQQTKAFTILAPVKGYWYVDADQESGLEGPDGGTLKINVDECTQRCRDNPKCRSFSFCHIGTLKPNPHPYPGAPAQVREWKHRCYLKPHEVTTNTSMIFKQGCTSYGHIESTAAWRPKTEALLKPSKAPSHTFYMYRAVDNKTFSPSSLNTASLGGVMWYLHNEIVCHCPRKNGVDRIVRYKVTTKATQPLYDKNMNFGIRHAFDFGKCTGPAWLDKEPSDEVPCDFDTWDKYGYVVGCNDLNSHAFPFPTWHVAYPDAVWYSVPGACPSRFWGDKDKDCNLDEPGGICVGPPTGQGNCTISIEEAGFVLLDDVVGIDNGGDLGHVDWCKSGHNEYNFPLDKGVNFDFWNSIWDKDKNRERMDAVDEAFGKKYPKWPRDKDLPQPKCDFNRHFFYSKGHPAWLPDENYTEAQASPWNWCHPNTPPKEIGSALHAQDWR